MLLEPSKRFGSNLLLSNQQFSDAIGPIDRSLPCDDLNLDNGHLESLFTGTAHIISETGVGDEFFERA